MLHTTNSKCLRRQAGKTLYCFACCFQCWPLDYSMLPGGVGGWTKHCQHISYWKWDHTIVLSLLFHSLIVIHTKLNFWKTTWWRLFFGTQKLRRKGTMKGDILLLVKVSQLNVASSSWGAASCWVAARYQTPDPECWQFLSFSPAAAAAALLPYTVLCSACPSVLKLHVVGVSLKYVLQSENYLKNGNLNLLNIFLSK